MENNFKYPIRIYPTNDVVYGKITHDQYIEDIIFDLINDFYYGRRFDPSELQKLFNITVKILEKIEKNEMKLEDLWTYNKE